jgi:hypothetical protein
MTELQRMRRDTNRELVRASLAHALLEPLHHHLIRRHPRATCAIFLFNRRREPERLASCVANDISVGLGAQRRAIDCAQQ